MAQVGKEKGETMKGSDKKKMKAFAKRWAKVLDKMADELDNFDEWDSGADDNDKLLPTRMLVDAAGDILNVAAEQLHQIAGVKEY